MRAVVQRVSRGRVVVGGETRGEIGRGVCVLLGVARDDDRAAAERLAGKVARLRIFENEDFRRRPLQAHRRASPGGAAGGGRFDRSLLDIGGEGLVVSQFTLIADTRKGNRPSFSEAAPPEQAEPLYEAFCSALAALGVSVQQGVFGARMQVELTNDGPVTIVLDV